MSVSFLLHRPYTARYLISDGMVIAQKVDTDSNEHHWPSSAGVLIGTVEWLCIMMLGMDVFVCVQDA